jgi:hypothetical protein
MLLIKSAFLLSCTAISLYLSSCSGDDTKRDGSSNSPAANTEPNPDSTGLMPKENVKTAQEDYRDTTKDSVETNRASTDQR